MELRQFSLPLLLAVLMFGGATAAHADWTLTTKDNNSRAVVNTSRTTITVKDINADGNRAYANYWRNDRGTTRFQIVTYSYKDSARASLGGSARIASFQACSDHPVLGDTCTGRKYI